jgi:hypothetical protein
VDVDSATHKIWMTFQALGNIAFAYSYTIILIEIQVRKATLYSYSTIRTRA